MPHGATILKQTDIHKARRHLQAADPVMRVVIDAVGPFTLRLERDRFGMLVRSIISQQITVAVSQVGYLPHEMDAIGPE
jgi:3-methyladenine DNA glycosylase/8-oxoguanine DNA glycosylase